MEFANLVDGAADYEEDEGSRKSGGNKEDHIMFPRSGIMELICPLLSLVILSSSWYLNRSTLVTQHHKCRPTSFHGLFTLPTQKGGVGPIGVHRSLDLSIWSNKSRPLNGPNALCLFWKKSLTRYRHDNGSTMEINGPTLSLQPTTGHRQKSNR